MYPGSKDIMVLDLFWLLDLFKLLEPQDQTTGLDFVYCLSVCCFFQFSGLVSRILPFAISRPRPRLVFMLFLYTTFVLERKLCSRACFVELIDFAVLRAV